MIQRCQLFLRIKTTLKIFLKILEKLNNWSKNEYSKALSLSSRI